MNTDEIQVKKIIEHVDNWKTLFNIKTRKYLIYTFIPNEDSNVFWGFQNSNKIEFIIKKLTVELKNAIQKELKKNSCSCKFVKMQKYDDYEYKLIVKEKSVCVIS